MSAKALSGVKVIELSQFVAGPYCAKFLAHQGADVIKIEPPENGDCLRSVGPFLKDDSDREKSGFFLYLNQNKLGVTLDIHKKKGREVLRELIKETDILIESFPPSKRAELGLDFQELQKLNPRLIMTSITPFGQYGPYSNYKAYDINIQAASGLSSIIGDPDREPLRIPGMQAHFQSALNAAVATLTALYFREESGRGQHIDISEQECSASILGDVLSNASMHNRTRKRSPTLSDMGSHKMIWPIGNFETKDGYINTCLLEPHQWKGLVDTIGNPEWALDPKLEDMYRTHEVENPDEISRNIQEAFKEYSTEELFCEAQKRRVPLVAIKDVSEVLNSPQLVECEFFDEIEHPVAGKLKYPGAPFRLSETPWSLDRPAPLLGQHNKEIYSKLGYSQTDLEQMATENII